MSKAKAVLPKPGYGNIVAFGLYCALTYLMVYLPVSIDLSKQYLGHGEVAFWSNYFWWFDHAISNFMNPLRDSYIFYPLGLGMTDGIFPFLAFIPVTHWFGPVVSYNLYVLSSFALAGYGMFLLSRFVFKDVFAGFVAGLIFAFFLFHFGAAMGHLHTFSVMWVPFFILFFVKMYDDPSWANIFFSSLFLAVNAGTSWTITVMIAIFCLFYVCHRWSRTFSRELFPRLAIFLLLSLSFIAPGLYIILSEAVTNKNMSKPLGEFIYYSADLLAFITPSPFHPIWGDASRKIYAEFGSNMSEKVVFIGYSVILLTVAGTHAWAKEKVGRFFLLISIVFFVLSLGPVLHVFGVWRFTEHNLTVMLPGILTKYIPFLDMIRVPSRYDIMFMFCVSLIAGYGSHDLFEKRLKGGVKALSRKPLLTFFIAVLILFEYLAVLPVQATKAIPKFYYSIQEKDGNGPIMEVPIGLVGLRTLDTSALNTSILNYYEYQTVHHRPIMGGYWSRISGEYAGFLERDPVLLEIYTGKKDIVESQVTDRLSYLKTKYGISHIVLHRKYLREQDLAFLISSLGENYSLDNSVGSDPLIIYRTGGVCRDTFEKGVYISGLGKGWHREELWNDLPARWMSDDAEILVHSDEKKTVDLEFLAHSFMKPRILEIHVDGILQSRIKVPTGIVGTSASVNLQQGKNVITLHVPEGCQRPFDIPALKNKDKRCLSIGIQSIRVNPS